MKKRLNLSRKEMIKDNRYLLAKMSKKKQVLASLRHSYVKDGFSKGQTLQGETEEVGNEVDLSRTGAYFNEDVPFSEMKNKLRLLLKKKKVSRKK